MKSQQLLGLLCSLFPESSLKVQMKASYRANLRNNVTYIEEPGGAETGSSGQSSGLIFGSSH